LTPHILADDYLTGIHFRLDSRSGVDAVTVEIAISSDCDITDMDADAQMVRVTRCGRLCRVLATQCYGGADRHFRALELGEDRIAKEFHHSSFIFLDGLT
jgi:hypothetical protein